MQRVVRQRTAWVVRPEPPRYPTVTLNAPLDGIQRARRNHVLEDAGTGKAISDDQCPAPSRRMFKVSSDRTQAVDYGMEVVSVKRMPNAQSEVHVLDRLAGNQP